MGNISAAFMYDILPIPLERRPPELAYVRLPSGYGEGADHIRVALAMWNVAWEAGQYRQALFREEDFPPSLKPAAEVEGNVYLMPRTQSRYIEYAPLYHLVPRRIAERHALPLLREGTWPPLGTSVEELERELPPGFGDRLANAFADVIWKRLSPRSPASAFSDADPIRLLSHNLDYWVPHALAVMEDELRLFDRVTTDEREIAEKLRRARRDPYPGATPQRPRQGGTLWQGEAWAAEVADLVVGHADAAGRLRALFDAVRSNRVHDDFSDRWSREREDFERRINHRRAKVEVAFIELPESVPVHGPESQVEGRIITEDFLALLDARERRIVVLLSAGITNLGDIAARLGYKGHSPVSKALTRIRRKAEHYFDLT
jgi:hypothetical protein